MKKKRSIKLSLNKERISDLNKSQMLQVNGGTGTSYQSAVGTCGGGGGGSLTCGTRIGNAGCCN